MQTEDSIFSDLPQRTISRKKKLWVLIPMLTMMSIAAAALFIGISSEVYSLVSDPDYPSNELPPYFWYTLTIIWSVSIFFIVGIFSRNRVGWLCSIVPVGFMLFMLVMSITKERSIDAPSLILSTILCSLFVFLLNTDVSKQRYKLRMDVSMILLNLLGIGIGVGLGLLTMLLTMYMSK